MRHQLNYHDISTLTANIADALDAVCSVIHYQQTQAIGNTSHSPAVAVETILQLQALSDSISRKGYATMNALTERAPN
jgi:hypothetical protein